LKPRQRIDPRSLEREVRLPTRRPIARQTELRCDRDAWATGTNPASPAGASSRSAGMRRDRLATAIELLAIPSRLTERKPGAQSKAALSRSSPRPGERQPGRPRNSITMAGRKARASAARRPPPPPSAGGVAAALVGRGERFLARRSTLIVSITRSTCSMRAACGTPAELIVMMRGQRGSAAARTREHARGQPEREQFQK
jgi:hypothetical protein